MHRKSQQRRIALLLTVCLCAAFPVFCAAEEEGEESLSPPEFVEQAAEPIEVEGEILGDSLELSLDCLGYYDLLLVVRLPETEPVGVFEVEISEECTAEAELTVIDGVSSCRCPIAPQSYALLSVTQTPGDGQHWAFGGAALYAMPDSSACLLISECYCTEATLSPEGMALLTLEAGSAPELELNGDVNRDGEVNIADANIVFQLISEGAGYYDLEHFSLHQRLLADMDGDHMYTIADLDAILSRLPGLGSAD